MISLLANSGDDPAYIAIVSRIISNELIRLNLREIFLVQINHWFDYKWLRFSGKAVGALGVFESNLTVPPFHPNRVLYEWHLINHAHLGKLTIEPATPLHYEQRSGENLNRKICFRSKSGLFVWYSGATKETDKASLMIYTSQANEQEGWYVSFQKTRAWQVHQMKGISKPAIKMLMQENHI